MLLLLLWAQAAPEKVLFEDPLTGSLKEGWTWVREEAAARKHDKDGLHLRVQGGSLWEKSNSARNVLLRNLPSTGVDGPVAVEVRVANAPQQTAEQAGVLLYLDDDTYVKLVRERLEQRVKVVFARESEARGFPLTIRDDDAAAHRLRLTWSGSQVTAEMRADGAPKWTSLGYCESPFPLDLAEKVRGGIVAHGAPKEAERWAVFRDFRVVVPPPEER